MSDGTKIQWADASWNPITGCTKVSQGCKNCYAAELHDRRHQAYLKGAKLPAQYAKPFNQIQLHPDRLEMPLHWKKPRRIFVNSTSDLFHEDVPASFVADVYDVMAEAKQHTFIVLTKRPERIVPILYGQEGGFYLGGGDFLPNVWHLTSVEDQKSADLRIPELLKLRTMSEGWPVLGLSCEPLLGPVDLTHVHDVSTHTYYDVMGGSRFDYDLDGHGVAAPSRNKLDWVIVGGESGLNARPMHPDWARSLRDQCQAAGVSFFFKQWGEWYPAAAQYGDDDFMDKLDFGAHCICLGNRGTKFREEWGDKEEYWCGYQPDPEQNPWFMERIGKKRAGRLLDGREWNEYPAGAEE